MLRASLALASVLVVVAAACGSSDHTGGFTGGSSSGGDDMGGGPDATSDGTLLGGPDSGTISGDSGSAPHTCNPTSLDLEGCSCAVQGVGATRKCYTGPANTENVGQCKDGTQSCAGSSEAPSWGPCTGSVTPAPEVCDGMVDANCNGKTGCNDPTCTTTPLCQGCSTEGATRPCYDGPAGTENVGICKDGTQTCTNGMWGACTGEVLPDPWNQSFCCDAVDHECNGVVGCYNLFKCITAACCQSSCDAGGGLDPGCVCMTGSGDTATCPQGDHYVHKGGLPGTDECCPCTAANCGDFNCCGESVCAGSSACSGYTCNPLPASCNGQVSADCDDFPEDCDEPCCECTQGC
ncbi:MAG TPA: hypothetical protein VF765_05895 [Polyangiaceae bacterium]